MDRRYVEIDLDRRWSVIVRVGELWLVLGRGHARRGGRFGAVGEPPGAERGAAAGQQRRARCAGSGGHGPAGPAAGGVDRAAGDPGAARAGPLSGEVGGVGFGAQGPGPRGARQAGRGPGGGRHLRSGRGRPARRHPAGGDLPVAGDVVAAVDRALRRRGPVPGADDPRPAARPRRLPGDPRDPRDRRSPYVHVVWDAVSRFRGRR
jgi:hypothetical protein